MNKINNCFVTYNERDMFDNINNKLIIQQFQKMKPHEDNCKLCMKTFEYNIFFNI